MTTTTDHAEHIAAMRDAAAQLWHNDDDNEPLAVLDAIIDFAEERGLYLAAGDIDLWGFGRVRPMYRTTDNTYWIRLPDLVEPTGLSYRELLAVFEDEYAEQPPDDPELLRFVGASGTVIPLADDAWVMRVFATHSPWAPEFSKNMSQVFRHAMVASGLADRIGGSSTGVMAITTLRTVEGDDLTVTLPVESLSADGVPMVRSPFDDAAPGELLPVTALTDKWTLEQPHEAAHEMFAPSTTPAQAAAQACRGPVVDTEN
ncbi:hypothetical protein [Actinomadura rupiterrae]|uniref:hypothetical protein n=1 Tax=Actinomadura rupiterrae TaxID=559627 RepID=UPI0020A57199|nr:hypothetical protein [Actinomadura rupiterrae]MCP2336137.1 hypothetical protein [Actinomadura rupiterrae]